MFGLLSPLLIVVAVVVWVGGHVNKFARTQKLPYDNKTLRNTQRWREKEMEIETERQTERDGKRKKDRQRGRQRGRQRDVFLSFRHFLFYKNN